MESSNVNKMCVGYSVILYGTGTRIADNIQAIMEYLPRIIQQVERLANLTTNHDSQPFLLNDVMSWFAFDFLGEFMFNSDFGMMHDEVECLASCHCPEARCLGIACTSERRDLASKAGICLYPVRRKGERLESDGGVLRQRDA